MFTLDSCAQKNLKEIGLKLPPSGNIDAGDESEWPVIFIALPSTEAAAASTAKLTPAAPDKPVTKGDNSMPYTISGSGLQFVAEIRFLNVPIAFTCATDGTSITIPQLPAAAVANAGDVPLEIRLSDGSRQVFMVIVK